MRTDTRVVLLGVGIAVCLVAVRFLASSPDKIPLFLVVMAAAFLCYFGALLLVRRAAAAVPAIWIVLVAAAIQLAPYRGTPLWDTDAYRYHWDGLLLAHGVNPYQYPPGDHRLARLRDHHWDRIDYKHINTIYPPVTQFLVGGSYLLDRTPRRILLLAMGFNLLCLWPLLLLMRARGVEDKWLLIYAWNPLLANEFAIGGHLDPISVFYLLSALYWLERKRPGWAGTVMGLAVMAKTQMLLAAPLLLRRTGVKGIMAFVGVCVVLMVPFVGAGRENLLSGSLAYLRQWENNSSIFALLQAALGSEPARVITGCAVLGLVAWLTWRRGDVVLHVGLVLGALLLLSPTFFPWYVSWVLPIACFYPTVTGIAVTFLLLAPYVYYYDKSLGLVMRIPEFVLLYGIAAAEYVLWRRRRARVSPPPGPTPTSGGSPSAP